MLFWIPLIYSKKTDILFSENEIKPKLPLNRKYRNKSIKELTQRHGLLVFPKNHTVVSLNR